MALEHPRVEPREHLPDGSAPDPEMVRGPRRPHIETRIGGAEQELELGGRQVRMGEGRREAVELLPVGFIDERLHLLPEWRSRIRGEDLELREGRAKLDRVV